jgi:hypothetical protein
MPVALTLFWSQRALAFPSSRLVYSRDRGAERCPDEDVVRREVASRLGYDPFFPTADRAIIAEVKPAPKGFRATVHLVDKTGIVRGKRELHSPGRDCAELLKSIALAISIAIDPDAVEEPQPPPGQSDNPTPAVPPATIPNAPPGLAMTPQETPEFSEVGSPNMNLDVNDGWTLIAGAGGRVATGVAPGASGGATLFFGANWRWLAALLEATADLPASNEVVSSRLLFGSIVICGQARVLFACGLASLGALFAEGERSDHSAYAAVGGRAGASLPLGGPLALRLYLEAAVPVVWRDIIINVDSHEVWRLPAVSGGAGMQVVLRFP